MGRSPIDRPGTSNCRNTRRHTRLPGETIRLAWPFTIRQWACRSYLEEGASAVNLRYLDRPTNRATALGIGRGGRGIVNLFARIEELRASSKFLDWLLAAALACPIAAASHDAAFAGCKPDHFKPLFFIKSMGECSFDAETLSYAGTPVRQAMWTMRGM